MKFPCQRRYEELGSLFIYIWSTQEHAKTPKHILCLNSTTDEEMLFNLPQPQLAPSLSNAALMDNDLWATRKPWCISYSLHWDTEGWWHRNHLILEAQELTMYDRTIWALPSLPEHSKIPEPSSKGFWSLPKWSPLLSRLRNCPVLLGVKSCQAASEQDHTVSTMCIQTNQEGK